MRVSCSPTRTHDATEVTAGINAKRIDAERGPDLRTHDAYKVVAAALAITSATNNPAAAIGSAICSDADNDASTASGSETVTPIAVKVIASTPPRMRLCAKEPEASPSKATSVAITPCPIAGFDMIFGAHARRNADDADPEGDETPTVFPASKKDAADHGRRDRIHRDHQRTDCRADAVGHPPIQADELHALDQ